MLVDNALDVIMIVDRDGTIRFGSPSLRRVLGFDPGELVGQSVFSLIHPEDVPYEKQGLKLVTGGERGYSLCCEVRLGHRDGSWRGLELTVTNLLEEPGIEGILCNCRDITLRKETERALREQLHFLQVLIDAIPHPVFFKDAQGIYLGCNRAFETYLGRGKDEIIGKTVHDVAPPEVADVYREADLALFRDRGVQIYESAVISSDGTARDVIFHKAAFLNEDGTLGGLVGTILDITDRKRVEETLRRSEEQLRQSQKMEAVGRLAGGIAHDFNNLLTAIMGYGELILARLSPGDPLRREIEEIRKAGDRAAALTHQLLVFSRRQVLQPKVLDLNTVVANMDKMLRRLIGEDVELVTVLGAGLGRVTADPGQLEQVIVNLAVNSRDAMPKGGRLTIETANVNLDDHYPRLHAPATPGSYVLLAVSDTGIGMDDEVKSHVFEPFFTTKPRGKGTGLGLSTVYGIVSQSGGHVRVYSEVGRGTAFKIYLPRVTGALEPDAPEPSAARREGSETVLLVEDEQAVRSLVCEILRAHGYTVLDVPNAGEALLVCERHGGPVHLMLTDVVMPRMGGPELAERLGPLRPSMKVLYMSGYTDDAVVRHGVLSPGVAFLQKPFSPDALLRKVRETLDAP